MENIEEIIQHYDNELQKYINTAYSDFREIVEKERTPYLAQIEALSDLYFFQNYLQDSNIDLFENLPIPLILFYTKIANDVYSSRHLLFHGQIVSALTIQRSLYETFLTAKLILENNTKKRLELYENYMTVSIWLRKKEYDEYILKLKNNPNIAKEYYQDFIKEFEELYETKDFLEEVDNFDTIKKNYHPKKPFNWAWNIFKDETAGQNPSIKFISEKLGNISDYFHVYSTNSLAVHNQPLMLNFMLRQNSLTSFPQFNDKTGNVAALTMSFAIETIIRILNYAKMGEVENIEAYLNNKFNETFRN